MKKIKDFFKKYYKIFLIYIIIFIIMMFPLPYYIELPGGLINISNRVEVENKPKLKGTFNMSYVTVIKSNLSSIVLSYIKKDWDIIKKDEVVAENENYKDTEYRDHMMLEEANDNAIQVSFEKANKKINIVSSKMFVTYIYQEADTDLKIGDQIISVNNIDVSSNEEIINIIKNLNAGDKIDIEVLNNEKQYYKSAVIKEINNNKIIGIILTYDKDFKTNPQVKINFKNNEEGPSGGLMMALTIYNSLIDEDLTHGYKIAGTGTIDIKGKVGEIGGVKYKLLGAKKEKADIFFIPSDNYNEAKKIVKDKNINIKLIKVDTFNEAVNYLKKMN